jgi:NAD(P)-dependent dehydrogenase (short-subunit alcohol dehydrogenase family)
MLDGLVNNAGIEVAGPLADLRTDQLQHHLEVNLAGPFIVTKTFLPLFGANLTRKGRPGRIALSVASIFNNSRMQRLHR